MTRLRTLDHTLVPAPWSIFNNLQTTWTGLARVLAGHAAVITEHFRQLTSPPPATTTSTSSGSPVSPSSPATTTSMIQGIRPLRYQMDEASERLSAFGVYWRTGEPSRSLPTRRNSRSYTPSSPIFMGGIPGARARPKNRLLPGSPSRANPAAVRFVPPRRAWSQPGRPRNRL